MKIGKVSSKKYKCGICGQEQNVQTNHFGEIYSGCKNCSNTTLYCIEPEAQRIPDCTYVLKYYYFNIETQEKEYIDLVQKMKELNYKKWEDLCPFYTGDFFKKWEYIKSFDSKEMNIYNPEQFEGPYISDGIRLHDWVECKLDNKRIKKGYYLIKN